MLHQSLPSPDLSRSWTDAEDARCDIYSGRCLMLLGIGIAAGLTACRLVDYPQADRLLPTLSLAAAFVAAGWAVLSGKLDRAFPWSGAPVARGGDAAPQRAADPRQATWGAAAWHRHLADAAVSRAGRAARVSAARRRRG